MNTRKYKMRLQNFWRDNERLIVMIILSFLLGLTIAGLNYWNYNTSTQKFSLEGTQVVSNQQNAEFSFNIGQPSLAKETTLTLTLENVSSSLPVEVYLNGEKLRDVSRNDVTISISASQLEKSNIVQVRRSTLGFYDQKLVDASVTSHTNFQQLMFVVLNMAALLLMAAPLMYVKYTQFIRRKKMEEKFPEFLREIVEGTRAGMSLPQAIQNTETGNYGPLDEKIQKMDAQLDWGIPFDQVLQNFAEDTGSNIIRQSVDTIIQAYESGGNIEDVLESVGENIRSIKKLKEERESQLYGEMITGYIVYFIFIGILVALTTYLLPNLATAQQSLGGTGITSFGGGGGPSLQENIALYKQWFKRLVYIQAFFSGLIIGKLSEGELKAGLKHMAILFAAGYLAVTFFL